jgi:hypothetical protein
MARHEEDLQKIESHTKLNKSKVCQYLVLSYAGVAERSNALDCKSSVLVTTEVQILSPGPHYQLHHFIIKNFSNKN